MSYKILLFGIMMSLLIFSPIIQANAMKIDSGMEDLMSNDMEEKTVEDEEKTKTKSPLKQMKIGVDVHNIQCKSGHELVFKSSDWSPACVKSSSIERLLQIGWASDHKPSHDDTTKTP